MSAYQGLRYCYPLSIRSNDGAQRYETVNLKTVTLRPDVQRWELSIKLEPHRVSPDDNAYGKYLSQKIFRGLNSSFAINMPQLYADPGQNLPAEFKVETDETAAGEAAVGTDRVTIIMDGARNNINVSFLAGLFFTFAGDTKVYLCREYLSFTELEKGVLKFYPRLRKATAQLTRLNFSPVIQVKYADDGTDAITIGNKGVLNETINVIEAI